MLGSRKVSMPNVSEVVATMTVVLLASGMATLRCLSSTCGFERRYCVLVGLLIDQRVLRLRAGSGRAFDVNALLDTTEPLFLTVARNRFRVVGSFLQEVFDTGFYCVGNVLHIGVKLGVVLGFIRIHARKCRWSSIKCK